ncbi:hypothetical protein Tco_1053471 [Tanacetum coccineum]
MSSEAISIIGSYVVTNLPDLEVLVGDLPLHDSLEVDDSLMAQTLWFYFFWYSYPGLVQLKGLSHHDIFFLEFSLDSLNHLQ